MGTTIATMQEKLPRRDLYVIPALSILTLLFLLVGSEVTARLLFPEQKTDACEVSDPQIGFRYKSGCTTRVKAAEGPWVVNQYNDCGYRTNESCKTKPEGSIRLALIGSSIAEGWLVSYEQTMATRAAVDLQARCRRPVEVQNLGRQLCPLNCIYHRVDEALALKPNVLMLTMNASDIDKLSMSDLASRDTPIGAASIGNIPVARQDLVRRVKARLSESRAVIVAEHFLFQDPSTYLQIALLNPNATGFMRQPYDAAWEEHMQAASVLISAIAQKAKAASVPVVLIAFPSAAQAAALSLQHPPAGVVPDAFMTRLAKLSAADGITFVDPSENFRHTPGSNKLFYLADGHLNGEGQALISKPLVDTLVSGPRPLLPGCTAQLP